jgi:hypothetical protein
MSNKDTTIEDLCCRAEALPQAYKEILYAEGLPPDMALQTIRRARERLRAFIGVIDMAEGLITAPEPKKRAAG